MSADTPSSNPAAIPRREYGRDGVRLSIVAMGGIVLNGLEQPRANRLVAEAFERGVNYYDVAPEYGPAETILGPALEPYRARSFLACKTLERTKAGAEKELKRSLERLRTDHVDLYQLHAISDVKKDVDAAFAKGGAMEVFIEAKKSGRARHLGFSAHSPEAAMAAMDRFDFDSVLFPVNFACDMRGSFASAVIERAKAKGMSVLALKAMARQVWPHEDPQRKTYKKCWYQPLADARQAELAFRYTLSRPVTAAVPPGEETLFRMAMDFATRFAPITSAEVDELRQIAAPLTPIFPKA